MPKSNPKKRDTMPKEASKSTTSKSQPLAVFKKGVSPPYVEETNYYNIPARCNVALLYDLDIDGVKTMWKFCEQRQHGTPVAIMKADKVPGGWIWYHFNDGLFFLANGNRFDPKGSSYEKQCDLIQEYQPEKPAFWMPSPGHTAPTLPAPSTVARITASESVDKPRKSKNEETIIQLPDGQSHMKPYKIPVFAENYKPFAIIKDLSGVNKMISIVSDEVKEQVYQEFSKYETGVPCSFQFWQFKLPKKTKSLNIRVKLTKHSAVTKIVENGVEKEIPSMYTKFSKEEIDRHNNDPANAQCQIPEHRIFLSWSLSVGKTTGIRSLSEAVSKQFEKAHRSEDFSSKKSDSDRYAKLVFFNAEGYGKTPFARVINWGLTKLQMPISGSKGKGYKGPGGYGRKKRAVQEKNDEFVLPPSITDDEIPFETTEPSEPASSIETIQYGTHPEMQSQISSMDVENPNVEQFNQFLSNMDPSREPELQRLLAQQN